MKHKDNKQQQKTNTELEASNLGQSHIYYDRVKHILERHNLAQSRNSTTKRITTCKSSLNAYHIIFVYWSPFCYALLETL